MNKIKNFIKNEIVLCIAIILAFISSVFVGIDSTYIDYIDFSTLAILFCLMTVMAGLSDIGVFDKIARFLIRKFNSFRSIVSVLIFLCFFFGMFITNDVALITFVPLSIIVLKLLGNDNFKKWIIPVVIMQTIAANLGSMLLPMGNPQNLYLFSKSKMSLIDFIGTMLPYTVLSFVLILIWIIVSTAKNNFTISISMDSPEKNDNRPVFSLVCYLALFLLCLCSVIKLIPYQISFVIVLVAIILFNYRILLKVDYALLFTFVALFIFIGNMQKISFFNNFLLDFVSGKEVFTAIASSQVISNVPSALLLSGFTDKYHALLVGVNLGGLGTLIASMASLISYKYVIKEANELRGKYILKFTIYNIIFLLILVLFDIF